MLTETDHRNLDRFRRTLAEVPHLVATELPEGASDLVSPRLLTWDMIVYRDEGDSGRIACCRSQSFLEDWLLELMRAFGHASNYYIHPGSGGVWWGIAVARADRLLVDLWKSCMPVLDLLLLSSDGGRALAVSERESWICGVLRPVRECKRRSASRERLGDLLNRVDDVLPVPRAPLDVRVRESELFAGEPYAILPRAAPVSRRDRWLGDCLRRMRSRMKEPNLFPPSMNLRGPYYLSLGDAEPLPWTEIHPQKDDGWIGTLFRSAPIEKMVIMSHDLALVLGLRATAQRYEAFLAAPSSKGGS